MVGAIIVGNALPATGVQSFLVPAGVTLTTTAPITVNDNGTFTVENGGTLELANTFSPALRKDSGLTSGSSS